MHPSYLALCLVQGAVVLLPRVPRSRLLSRLRRRWPILLAVPGAATAATYVPDVASGVAGSVATIALVVVPPLAALGAAWLQRWHDPLLAAVVPLLLVLALGFPEAWVGSWASLVVVVLAAVALGALAVAVVPARVVAVGLFLWAAIDLASALAHALEASSAAIVDAAPAVAPQLELHLQRVQVGSTSMEFADLFVAAALGALLVVRGRARAAAAAWVAAFGMAMTPLFEVTDVLPATVPVAAALAVEALRARRRPQTYAPVTTASSAIATKSRAR